MEKPSGPPIAGADILGRRWLAVAAALASALASLPLVAYTYYWDQAVYADIADAMRRGGVVYRDVWEHRPPATFYTYYLAHAILPRDYWSIRVFEIAALAVCSSLLLEIGRIRFRSVATGWVAALSLPILYLLIGINTAQSETFQLPFITAAWAVWPRPSGGSRCTVRAFAGGVLLSIAALYKTPIAPLLGLAILDLLVRDRGGGGVKERFRLAAVATAGMLLLPILCLAYYAAAGAGSAFLEANVTFPMRYAGLGASSSIADHAKGAWNWLKTLLPLPAAAVLLAGVCRSFLHSRSEAVTWGGALLGSWLAVVVQGRYWDYHFIPILPFLSMGLGLVFCGGALPEPARGERRSLRALGPVVAWAALLAAGVFGYGPRLAPVYRSWGHVARTDPDGQGGGESANAEVRVARWVRSQIGRDAKVFVWGDAPILYFLADRPIAGPYCHLLGMIPPWGEAERLDDLIALLARENPEILIVARADPNWWHSRPACELLGEHSAMKDFIFECYRWDRTIGPFDIWRPKRGKAG